MENLLQLLNKVQTVSPLSVFEKEVIIVQNAGMQHWLNMSIATERGISLNIDYALPSQFLWHLVRSLASKEKVPEQSPYSREVLAWRIYRLLGQQEILADNDFTDLVNYFSLGKNKTQAQKGQQGEHDLLKRYQLSVELADLFEQYLVFRPDWLNNWQQGLFDLGAANASQFTTTTALQSMVLWQAKLWQLLQAEMPYNPSELIELACQHLSSKQHLLPKRIAFFGINAMAPMWLHFIEQLSEVTQVHFFHLNPCADYWGDIESEKQWFKRLNVWTAQADNELAQLGNPLLANLGQQGREFLALLQQQATYNFDVFSLMSDDNDNAQQGEQTSCKKATPSLLSCIQNDILTLTDARQHPQQLADDSLVITSAHSALREVQGLHDWLLHQFNQTELTPKDVLVMCPLIEQYAPYVEAVFTRGWQDLADDIPPLPCSIADRVSKDSDPLVIAFLALLSLPDSRFQVNQIIGFLRLTPVQNKFAIDELALDKIISWLNSANVYWGRSADHKQQILNTESASEQFTWQQGLSRLMRGFAYGEPADIYQEQLLLNIIEAGDAELLGQLMLLLEQLESHVKALTQIRSVSEWQAYLINLLESCFVEDDNCSFEVILTAIDKLARFSQEAQLAENLPLSIVKEFLTLHFSQPEAGKQFMVGQITFCSMLPMRSIPFKVIAILGLNDGDYPRQRKPVAFDLMQQTPNRVGDRSRRGDDRYLFLEALISARHSLYLSFQGRNIKNNNELQPSIVLKELMAYLADGYGWQLAGEDNNIRQLAMQPFSVENYQGKWPSFDVNWLKLALASHLDKVDNFFSPEQITEQKAEQNSEPQEPVLLPITKAMLAADTSSKTINVALTLSELLTFFHHAPKAFAQQNLALFFQTQQNQLENSEPFLPDHLTAYQIREQFLAVMLAPVDKSEKAAQIAQTSQQVLLSGNMPDSPLSLPQVNQWQQECSDFAKVVSEFCLTDDHDINSASIEVVDVVLPIEMNIGLQTICWQLTIPLPISHHTVISYRMSRAKPKDLMQLACYQLALQSADKLMIKPEDKAKVLALKAVYGIYFDTKAQQITKYQFSPLPAPVHYLTQLLQYYWQGQQQALLLTSPLVEKVLKRFQKEQTLEQTEFEHIWCDQNDISAPYLDPYLQYFWPKTPEIAQHLSPILTIYQPIFTCAVRFK